MEGLTRGEVNWLTNGHRAFTPGMKRSYWAHDTQSKCEPALRRRTHMVRQLSKKKGALLALLSFAVSASLQRVNLNSFAGILKNTLIILQHKSKSSFHWKEWDARTKTACAVLNWKDYSSPFLTTYFSSNRVSQITGCGFIDLMFFSAVDNMKYIPCKKQSSWIRYIVINCINTFSEWQAQQHV